MLYVPVLYTYLIVCVLHVKCRANAACTPCKLCSNYKNSKQRLLIHFLVDPLTFSVGAVSNQHKYRD